MYRKSGPMKDAASKPSKTDERTGRSSTKEINTVSKGEHGICLWVIHFDTALTVILQM